MSNAQHGVAGESAKLLRGRRRLMLSLGINGEVRDAARSDRSIVLDGRCGMKPVRRIRSWSPILINGRFVSLSGIDQYGESWISTTLAEFDIEAGTATTISGRPYMLVGDHEPEAAFRNAMRILSQRYDLQGASIEPITLEAAAEWLANRSEKPSLTDSEKARGELARAAHIWLGLLWERSESCMSDEDLARLTGLPLSVLSDLHKGPEESVGQVDLDDAETGLGRMRERSWLADPVDGHPEAEGMEP